MEQAAAVEAGPQLHQQPQQHPEPEEKASAVAAEEECYQVS